MSFTPNIPTATQSLGQTQQPIQDNFTILRKAAGSAVASEGDHADLATSNIGKHKYVHFVQQTVNPSALATESVLFQKSAGSHTELFYLYGSSGNAFQLTNNGGSSGNPGFTGIMSTPGKPMSMVWGQVSSIATSGTVTVPGIINGIYSIMLTPTCGGTPHSQATYSVTGIGPVGPLLVNQFTWRLFTGSSDYTGFYWLVIGS